MTMDANIIIGLAAGALTTGSSIPQIVKIVQTKSSKDVSTLFFMFMAVGMSLWLIYGLFREDFAIVLWNLISLAFCLTILGLKVKYR